MENNFSVWNKKGLQETNIFLGLIQLNIHCVQHAMRDLDYSGLISFNTANAGFSKKEIRKEGWWKDFKPDFREKWHFDNICVKFSNALAICQGST